MKAFHKFSQFNPYENKSIPINVAEVSFSLFNIFVNTWIPSHLVIFPGGRSEGFQNVWGRACRRFGSPGGVPEGLPVAQLEIRGEPQLGRHERLAVDQPDHLASNPTSRQLQQPCRLLSTWLRFFWGTVQRGKEIGIIHHTSVNSCYLLHNCMEQWQLYIVIWRQFTKFTETKFNLDQKLCWRTWKAGTKILSNCKTNKERECQRKTSADLTKEQLAIDTFTHKQRGEQTSSKDVLNQIQIQNMNAL